MKPLTRTEQKSLALHRSIAARLRNDPTLLVVAKQRLEWLRTKNPAAKPYYDQWADLLNGPLNALLATITSPSERACALRQENPFVDLVNQRERAKIFRETAAAIDRELR
jgi:hypothetical protein